jgi:hypothetical protein
MKQKLSAVVMLLLLVGLLAGLNAASYVQKEKTPDSEVVPNRSSFNSGATGTQALYTLLTETGRKTVRWQDSTAALATTKIGLPSVFVVIGSLRREFTDVEIEELLRWVSVGGRLIIIDREPNEKLVTTTSNWSIAVKPQDTGNPALFSSDPADQKQMTADTSAVKPVQPTVFTQDVNAIQPSRFTASIGIMPIGDGDQAPVSYGEVTSPSQIDPLVHFAHEGRNVVVDAPFGEGRIVAVSDPYVVSNGGIALADNAQFAINLVSVGDGIIAFDEFHQGYGTDNNRFLQFFEGTPVIPIFLQAAALVGFFFFSQSRRFARPVPEPEPDRLSKLEYVGAMAELQNRTKAYDLAIENIYKDFRRRVTRYVGLDNFTATIADIARLAAERSGIDEAEIAATMFMCEEIIRGEPTNRREVLQLACTLRAMEQKLGLTRTGKTRI